VVKSFRRDPVKWILWIVMGLGLVWAFFFVGNGPQYILNGMRFGSILMLGAIGLTLTYKILNFANFAHGDILLFGAYVAYSVDWLLVDLLPQWLPALADPASANLLRWLAIVVAILVSVAITILASFLIDHVLYRRMRRSATVVLVIASFGMALFMRAFIQAIWGVQNKSYAMRISLPTTFDFFGLFQIKMTPIHIVTIIVALLLVSAVHFFLKYTKTGKAMRAMSDNMDLAQVSGINIERMIRWTWGLGSGLAAVSGVFIGLNLGIFIPNTGALILLSLFAAVILGGIGSAYGAMLGGLVIGVAQTILIAPVKLIDISAFRFNIPFTDITLLDLSHLTLTIPFTDINLIDLGALQDFKFMIGSQYKPGIVFLLMILMLLVRPQGLIGKPERKG